MDIKRDVYLNKLIKAKDNGLPKVLTGIRRCGKSYLLKEIFRNYLLSTGVNKENIVYIGLDEDQNLPLRNPIELGKYVRELCARKRHCYVFLDEVQEVYTLLDPSLTGGKIVLAEEGDDGAISFVNVVLGLSRENNIDLYVTGSNSKMLSTDIITEFRDKATNIGVAPLSFEEYFSYAGGYAPEALLKYMRYGGMPLAVSSDSEEGKEEYLRALFETTYFRDIIEHNKLKRSDFLDDLCDIVSESIGKTLNADKIVKTYESRMKKSVDEETVNAYIRYFVDAFLLRQVERYDLRGRKKIGASRKYYFVDPGLRNARLSFAYQDDGPLLENVIYNELIYNGYSVRVGTFDTVSKKDGKSVRDTHEIDFYAVKGTRRYYIQVSSDISSAETRTRELRPFFLSRGEVKKILVLNKPIGESLDENGFTIIGATDFLLRFIKQ